MKIKFGIIGLLVVLFIVLGMTSSTNQLNQEGYADNQKSVGDIIGMTVIAILFVILAYYVIGFIFLLIGGVVFFSR